MNRAARRTVTVEDDDARMVARRWGDDARDAMLDALRVPVAETIDQAVEAAS